MALRRGFPAHAERIADEVRAECGLRPGDAFDPFAYAAELAIPVVALSELDEVVAAHFASEDRSGRFSAMTLVDGTRKFIVHNDSHSHVRQRSNLAHEIAHVLLGHEATPPLTESGLRQLDQEIEDEATYLGAALLVPREACIRIARRQVPIAMAAEIYDVSTALMQMRINRTGAMRIVSNSRRSR